MKITIKDVLRIILVLSCVSVTQLKPTNYLDDIQHELDLNAARLKALHTKVSAPRVQVAAPKQQTKTVRFAPTIKTKTMRPKRLPDLLAQSGFAKRTLKLWSYEGQAFLNGKPNVSPELLNLLERGHSLYVFKRNLRHVTTEEIIKSLESYLRCNWNEELEELLKVLKQGNYYEI